MIHDLWYAIRSLRRAPAFCIVAVTTLGLTVAALTTVLTLVNTLFVRRLPVPDPGRVVEVQATRQNGSRPGVVSYADYVHFRDATRTLRELAAVYPGAPLIMREGSDIREVQGAVVSANFFPVLNVSPERGRFFVPDEDAVPDRDRVAVLGYDFWRSRFGGADDVLGQDLVLNDVRFTVVGVAPPALRGLNTTPADVFLPSMMLRVGYRWCDVLGDPQCTILRMVGRLRDGVGVDAAGAEMAVLLPDQWRAAEDGDNSGVRVAVARPTEPGPDEGRLIQLLAATGLVLLVVSCGNLAGLTLARGSARAREIAIRLSLGVGPRRLVRQLTTESFLIAFAAAGVGLLLSIALTTWLDARFFSSDGTGRPLYFDFGLQPTVVFLVLVLSGVVGMAFGHWPARRVVRAGIAWSLRRSGQRPSLPRWLLASQVAFALAFVATAALLVGSARSAVAGANFTPDRVALARVRPRLIEYSPEQAATYLHAAAERLETLPGVASVSLVGTGAPLRGFTSEVGLPGSGESRLATGYIEVSPKYFATLGTPVLRGREFTEADDAGSQPVAVVSQSLAGAMGGEAIGNQVVVDGRPRQVVGVVADVPMQHRGEPVRPYVYVPFWQNPEQVDARVQVRAAVGTDPELLLPVIRRTLMDLDRAVPVTELSAMPDWLAGSYRPQRMSAAVVGYAAGLAVLLSAIGLYASLAFAVSHRTRELGIRQALGATRAGILALVLGEGARIVAVGLVAGVGGAFVVGRLVRHLLYGSAAGEVALLAGAVFLVALVGVLASVLPAMRAARVEPLQALKAER